MKANTSEMEVFQRLRREYLESRDPKAKDKLIQLVHNMNMQQARSPLTDKCASSLVKTLYTSGEMEDAIYASTFMEGEGYRISLRTWLHKQRPQKVVLVPHAQVQKPEPIRFVSVPLHSQRARPPVSPSLLDRALVIGKKQVRAIQEHLRNLRLL